MQGGGVDHQISSYAVQSSGTCLFSGSHQLLTSRIEQRGDGSSLVTPAREGSRRNAAERLGFDARGCFFARGSGNRTHSAQVWLLSENSSRVLVQTEQTRESY